MTKVNEFLSGLCPNCQKGPRGRVTCHTFIRVKLTEDGNPYIPKGTEGFLNPTEFSVNGDIITGNFYPIKYGEVNGFGEVRWPKFESVGPGTTLRFKYSNEPKKDGPV